VANLNPLRREDIPQYEDLLATMEQSAGFVPNAYLTMARRPGMLDALQGLIQQVFAGSVPRETKSLVALMSSYGAGCRYCQAHQATSLVHQGIDAAKLAEVADFERSDRFTDAERAAMRLAFASGQHPNAVTTAHFDDVRQYFDDGEVVEIVGVIAAFGFLNRWHETMATELEDKPSTIASQMLGGLRWEPGRHAGR
jgi:uncharacterized peroxidase-related enzyme